MNNNEYENLGITSQIVLEVIHGILIGEWELEDTALEDIRVSTFAEAGLLTHDKGLVLRLPDDTEYQITVIQRR